SFHDLVGQEHISTTLMNALRGGRLPQALLFTGVRGTGKTSSARILAMSLRCPNAKDYVPCSKCSECEDIASSRSLDVIEIDGASNNGVDAIRELRETVGYMPSSGKYKIYIIDEVHMLSTSAFNALLKTLEEPPPHVVFIMATTEVQKIPNTILSRCQRFDFRRIPSRQIASHLQKIAESEGIKVDSDAIWLVARQADGSMRDSQSLLDQVITFSGTHVTLQKAIDVLGLTDRNLLLECLGALVARDTEQTVQVIEKIFRAGYDSKLFAQDLLEEIRNALFVRLCGDSSARVVDLPDSEIQSLREMTSHLSEEDLHLLFDMCLKGVSDILRAQDARIVLEMLLLRMAAAPRVASLKALAQGGTLPQMTATAVPQPAKTVKIPVVDNGSAIPVAPSYSMSSFVRAAPGYTGPMPGQEPAQPQQASAPQAAKPAPKPSSPYDDETPKVDPARASDPWFQFVSKVKGANSLLGAMLENTHLISNEGAKLLIGVPKKMSFMLDKVKEPENVKRIETFLQTFWNKAYKVEVTLADEQATKQTPKAMAEDHKVQEKKSLEHAVEQHPVVQTAQNVFKGTIKSIKDTGKDGAGKRESR
ncbi:MAG TPA: DNA polymerase III subunit gamma/tau, partial [Bdellovibrionales bacterium]|nr:DNA polymerase III subunit gamma/tau [Bdellovibrionales bacterium]